ncbi:MAG: 50S ribosomal protein L6 [Candidatus Jorgensenbacteria bacterium]|nr:50S ribosomal protein L6 [Candidatus Jorgensenbacteria bacterium]
MSKIGKQIIEIPEGVTLDVSENNIVVNGPKGKLEVPLLRGVRSIREGNTIRFELINDTKQTRSNWGTVRALVANAVEGLVKGFEKKLILEGVGFKVTKEGEDLTMSLGFSHPVKYKKPEGVSFEVEKNSIVKISGFDKALVGQVAAEIRELKKPEPYKGKGFRYSDEVIQRKAGKKAAATAGKAA